MNPETARIIVILAILVAANAVIFMLWAVLSLSGTISREEEAREANRRMEGNQ